MPVSPHCPPDDIPATAEEVELHLALAIQSFGDAPNVAEMQDSTCWLLQHAGAAYPVVEARVRAHGEPGMIELLGRFDRADSTPLLAEILHGDAAGGQREAAVALANASDPVAAEVLRAHASDPRAPVASAALEGLRVRNDAADCDAVRAQLGATDPRLRFTAVETADALGCIDASALRAIARDDPDADVRAVAAELAKRRR